MVDGILSTPIWLLEGVRPGQGYVLVYAVGVAAMTVVGVSKLLGAAVVKRIHLALALAILAAAAVWAALGRASYGIACDEERLLEWLSADCLLCGWVLGAVMMVRLIRRKRTSPVLLLITMMVFVLFWREIEWGQPFFEQKIWYSRNFWEPRAYVDPSYFDEFARQFGLPAGPWYAIHLAIALSLWVLTIASAVYVARNGPVFMVEMAGLHGTTHGRYMLGAFGLYVLSEITTALAGGALGLSWLPSWLAQRGLSHCMLDEPIQLLSAMTLLTAMILLWKSLSLVEPVVRKTPRSTPATPAK